MKNQNDFKGVNSRIDPIQAAILAVKLEALDPVTARRREIAATYSAGFAKAGLDHPHVPVWHLYVIRHPQRDAFQQRLAEAGIGTVIHYPTPPHLQKAFADEGHAPGSLPLAERLAQEVLGLPMCPAQTDEQTEYAIDRVTALT
ncbi:DegT/DnrJ/EryC1/StrS family aminotransferase [Roseovarius sp. S4756]|uniref:DegT/DnrJ/EryC1/StrS family aminotransferase n=1 Tax=Roseovarius maritimus TaxID=3342637 RepID=UPI00372BEC25